MSQTKIMEHILGVVSCIGETKWPQYKGQGRVEAGGEMGGGQSRAGWGSLA